MRERSFTRTVPAAEADAGQNVPDQLLIRVHGSAAAPTLVYLPGLHGNWTLIGSFRAALADRLRFVEVSYPDSLTWSLEEHAVAVEEALVSRGITSAWLLAESFSSQVAWPLLARGKFNVRGLILAGGFVRHPMLWAVRMAEKVTGEISFALLTRVLFGYATISRWRFRSPETVAGIDEFVASLTEQTRQAAKHRLHLITKSDPCTIAKDLDIPVYALAGLLDPVVPWIWVRRWLKKNCAALRHYRVIWHADHNVLGTASRTAADQVVRWVFEGMHSG